MNKLNILVCTVFTLFFYSCGNRKETPTAKNDSTAATTQTTTGNKPTLIPDGPYKEVYPDGKVRIEGEMKNGTRFGLWKAFYPTGVQQSEDYFEDGKKNGKTATFFKNGRIRYVGYFSWDKPSGKWDFFDSTGTLVSSKEY